jgi:hypothetical protein
MLIELPSREDGKIAVFCMNKDDAPKFLSLNFWDIVGNVVL